MDYRPILEFSSKIVVQKVGLRRDEGEKGDEGEEGRKKKAIFHPATKLCIECCFSNLHHFLLLYHQRNRNFSNKRVHSRNEMQFLLQTMKENSNPKSLGALSFQKRNFYTKWLRNLICDCFYLLLCLTLLTLVSPLVHHSFSGGLVLYDESMCVRVC